MHFHIPKPLHGWREFFGEVGIIVFGILVALSLESLVGAWEHHKTVSHAKEDISDELRSNSAALRRLITSQEQSIPKLIILHNVLAARAAGHPQALPVGFAIREQFENVDSAAWESTVATQAFSYMPSSEVRAIAQAYSGGRELNDFEQLAVKQWVDLSSAPSDPKQLSVDDAKVAARQVAVAISYNASLRAAAAELLKTNAKALHAIGSSN